jgi:6-phosphogluconolactonase
MFVYVGALTAGNLAGEHAEGISVFEMDTTSGSLALVQTVADLHNPSFLAIHPELPVLYAGERQTTVFGPGEALAGSITSFTIAADGRLSLLNRQPSGGAAHVSVHPTGRYVFAAVPRSHCVMAFPVETDGRVAPASGIVQHQGRGVNPSTWEAPFPHSVFPDISGTRVLACDMGLDRVMLYDFYSETGRLQPSTHPFAQLSSGAGPRHLSLHPSNRFVYTVNELSSTISAFAYDAESSVMRILATLSTVPEGYTGRNSGAQIVVHPSGRFVYSSNRGNNSIATFTIDSDSGRPRLAGWEPSQGETPRNFNIDPSGRFMLVANQKSGDIVSFRIDPDSGKLSPTGHSVKSPSPVCVMFRDATR